jgi:AraC family transcriptional regulator of adaptative response / DNA-3-methyladenine glycosylase II
VLDADHCYRLLQTRDRRFDGWFVTAVRTTGIYCRPSCPAVMPKRPNVEFFPTSAAAQQHGYRACKRCRPDASPGSPEWDVRGDVVARAVRLVADGVVDREGVPGLARRLGYSERPLNRVMTDELGAGPLAIARAQRAHTARTLLETTDMALPAVAAASGFGSLRQFNDTVREVFASTPSALRRNRRATTPAPAGTVALELPVREPVAADQLLAFFAARAIPGVEHWDGASLHRALRLPRGHGVVVLSAPAPDRRNRRHVAARLQLADWRDLGAAVRRVRRLLDLDADPVAVDATLAADPALAPSVAKEPGVRVPGAVDGFEMAVRAVVGQQISVAGARTVAGRIVAAVGDRLTIDGGPVTHVFPSADALADIDPALLPMPRQRQRTVRELARRVAADELILDVGVDRDAVAAALVDVPGIGPWTAGYVLMRGLGDPDVFLPTDLGVRVGLDVLGLDASRAARWRPFRSYGLHHLWSVAGSHSSRPVHGG